MSNQRKITLRICRRAAYLLSANPAKTSRIRQSDDRDVISKNLSHFTTEKELIARCYQIS